mgnify:CR=1 FL=1
MEGVPARVGCARQGPPPDVTRDISAARWLPAGSRGGRGAASEGTAGTGEGRGRRGGCWRGLGRAGEGY